MIVSFDILDLAANSNRLAIRSLNEGSFLDTPGSIISPHVPRKILDIIQP